jgi:glycosyltransferase involved in cell wall biosynthesis
LDAESILCFAPDPWSDIWRNRHQIMSILAERNQVLYVEPRTYLRQTVDMIRAGQLRWRDLGGERVSEAQPNLYVYHNLPYAPISGRFPLKQIGQTLRRRSLRSEMRRLRFGAPILWLCRPEMSDLIGQFDEKLLVYHVVDEYSAYEGVSDPDLVRRREAEILERADLVLTTAPALWESKRIHNPNTHLVPNAVNYEAFAEAMQSDAPAPDDVAALPRPLIGYVGAINTKLDLSLFAAVAEAHPEWTLALVGPVRFPVSDPLLQKLWHLDNVHFLGTKPVEAVPYYIKALDVCLLPYRQNEWTRNISSLKLYEYLACGKPVVSSDVPAARDYADLVSIAGDAAHFTARVVEALRGSSQEEIARRMEVASRNTWRHRVAQISELIDASMVQKG